MVYVQSIDGVPLMPTERYGKVRRLLKENKAKVVQRTPFTIRLLYETGNIVQELSLGVDAGSKHIGLSSTSEEKEYYSADVQLRTDITGLLSTRRENRGARRNRKTRYRKPRFNNRTHSKHKGWLAPSVEAKIQTHLRVIEDVTRILPIRKIVIETAAFDTQMLRAKELGLPLPEGTDYQQGEQLYHWNVREYVLFRDGHECQCCHGKSGDPILNIHHLESRKTGGDAPNNLITLCETCHKAYHQGKIKLPEGAKRGQKYSDAAFMGIMRWTVYNRLKERYPDVRMTFGYITKNTRIESGLSVKDKEKDDKRYPLNHVIDARCVSGHPKAVPAGEIFYRKKVRCHNRQIHKNTILKGGYRKLNQAPKYVMGYQLFDKVRMPSGEEGFIIGRRSSGFFDVRMLGGTKLSAGISCKKLKSLEKRKTILTERRPAFPPHA